MARDLDAVAASGGGTTDSGGAVSTASLNSADAILRAAKLVRQGKLYSLARERFPGMPLFPGHPPFQVLSYRTPRGLRNDGTEPWGPGNEVQLGYMSELVQATTHSGAHIDAHAHMTIGDDDRWHGGSADVDLGDFGPLKGDACEIPPIWTRGILLDVPRHRGVECLAKGEPVAAEEFEEICRRQGVEEPQRGDVVLVRTGYMSHWPDPERLAAHRGPGPDASAARWLADRAVLAVGSDTETFEVQPAPDRESPRNPQPVHTLLLIEEGVYIMESLDLEELARDGVFEFLFVALPLKIRGATGSMIDPVAIV